MKSSLKIGLVVALLIGLVGVGVVAAASAGPQISWDVMASGGGVSSSGQVQVMDTIGQPIVGDSLAGTNTLRAGFWQVLGINYGIFLPLVSR